MYMIQAVVFDCFGVIYTSATTIAFDELGGNTLDDPTFYHDALRMRSLGRIDKQEMDDAIATGLGVERHVWQDAVASHRSRDERMMFTIKELRSSYKTALMSNIGRGVVGSYFSPDEQAEYFDAVIASADVGLIKPDPQIYALASKELNVPLEHMVFIDDNPRFVAAAKDLGMQGIVFSDYTQFQRELAEILDA